ncbi:MAG TPA: hypothetical protein VK427_04270, partial [Kofleriaceae bacterium]|nr:hypothetical protein [Kofleriaceae bacterium]
VRPLLSRTDMPELTHLRLHGAPFAGAIARTLASSPLARQLQVLDFAFGNFTPQDITVLAEHAASFPNLRELWMPFERMNAGTLPLLARLAKHVIPDSKAVGHDIDHDLAGAA